MRIIEFFTLIRRSVILDAKIYLQSKREFSGYTEEELQQLMEELSEKSDQSSLYKLNQLREFVGVNLPYKEKIRGYGMGEIRLGRTLEFDDSIYSLGFICQINDEILDPMFDVIKGKLIGKAAEEAKENEEEAEKEEKIQEDETQEKDEKNSSEGSEEEKPVDSYELDL